MKRVEEGWKEGGRRVEGRWKEGGRKVEGGWKDERMRVTRVCLIMYIGELGSPCARNMYGIYLNLLLLLWHIIGGGIHIKSFKSPKQLYSACYKQWKKNLKKNF